MITTFPSFYADSILNNFYDCEIPDEATLTEFQVRVVGVHSTGFKEYDQQLKNRTVRCALNIPTILFYYLEAVDVIILYEEDKYDIHRIIQGYLNEWREHLGRSINLRVTEHARMIKDLEELSNAIYDMLEDDVIKEREEVTTPTIVIRPIDIFNLDNDYVRETYETRYGKIFDLVNEHIDREN